MYTAKVVPAEHKDLIHDVSFDFYGKRMATCSSDQSVKVWDQDDKGEWTCTAEWRTHSGSVWRVTWASPEFGQVIATCSFDRTAAVWEEQVSEVNQSHHGGRSVHWVQRASLVDSRTSVTDIEFAPKHLGLQLATCSKDGIVRIYEAPDVMNLSHWSLQHEINTKLSCSCLSWNPSRMRSTMLAVGSDDQASTVEGKVQVYEYNDSTRKWHRILVASTITDPVNDVAFAPNFGRSYSLLAVASKDVHMISVKTQGKELQQSGGTSNRSDTLYTPVVFKDHDAQVWRVEWNITGTILASSGDDGCVRLWKANYLDNWKCVAELKGDGVPIPGAQSSKPLPSSIRDPGPFNASNPSSIRSHPMY